MKMEMKMKERRRRKDKLSAFLVIAVKEGEKAGLSAGGSLDTEEGKSFDHGFDLLKVKDEILKPESHSLSHSEAVEF